MLIDNTKSEQPIVQQQNNMSSQYDNHKTFVGGE